MNTTESIVEAFRDFRMPPTPIDQFETVGKQVLADKINSKVTTGEPIPFVMLGYPMKSANTRNKVIGTLPDLGEELSLKNFGQFNDAIKKIYPPGVNISIVSDGFIFSDLLGISDTTVEDYEQRSIDLAKVAPIRWYDLRDFYGGQGHLANMRAKVVEQFGITPVELERRILMEPDVNYLYRGMSIFMEEELAVKEFPSRNQLHKAAKLLTREMMLRNEAYSALIAHEFKDSVRLSMHNSINNGKKYSFQLIRSPKATRSPWHSVVYVNPDGVYETLHRKDAVAAGYHLVYKDGQPYNFES
jgi:pyoverdine/dityrosine biosynthesis protein Dit1